LTGGPCSRRRLLKRYLSSDFALDQRRQRILDRDEAVLTLVRVTDPVQLERPMARYIEHVTEPLEWEIVPHRRHHARQIDAQLAQPCFGSHWTESNHISRAWGVDCHTPARPPKRHRTRSKLARWHCCLGTQAATPFASGVTRADTNAGVGPAVTQDVLVASGGAGFAAQGRAKAIVSRAHPADPRHCLVAEEVVRPAPVGARKESSDRGLGEACMWQGAVEHGSPSLHYRVLALGA
jgi:hypothetical protein